MQGPNPIAGKTVPSPQKRFGNKPAESLIDYEERMLHQEFKEFHKGASPKISPKGREKGGQSDVLTEAEEGGGLILKRRRGDIKSEGGGLILQSDQPVDYAVNTGRVDMSSLLPTKEAVVRGHAKLSDGATYYSKRGTTTSASAKSPPASLREKYGEPSGKFPHSPPRSPGGGGIGTAPRDRHGGVPYGWTLGEIYTSDEEEVPSPTRAFLMRGQGGMAYQAKRKQKEKQPNVKVETAQWKVISPTYDQYGIVVDDEIVAKQPGKTPVTKTPHVGERGLVKPRQQQPGTRLEPMDGRQEGRKEDGPQSHEIVSPERRMELATEKIARRKKYDADEDKDLVLKKQKEFYGEKLGGEKLGYRKDSKGDHLCGPGKGDIIKKKKVPEKPEWRSASIQDETAGTLVGGSPAPMDRPEQRITPTKWNLGKKLYYNASEVDRVKEEREEKRLEEERERGWVNNLARMAAIRPGEDLLKDASRDTNLLRDANLRGIQGSSKGGSMDGSKEGTLRDEGIWGDSKGFGLSPSQVMLSKGDPYLTEDDRRYNAL